MSQDDVDLLIRNLIRGERAATEQDVVDILIRISTATFYPGRRNIPKPLQELMLQHGYDVPDQGDDLTFHWAKHVLGDQQWTPDTTPNEYFQHVLSAVAHPASWLVVQNAASGHDVAIVIAQTVHIVPEHHRGPRFGHEMIVVYSASTGRILSAYMTESSSRLTARPSTKWLRT